MDARDSTKSNAGAASPCPPGDDRSFTLPADVDAFPLSCLQAPAVCAAGGLLNAAEVGSLPSRARSPEGQRAPLILRPSSGCLHDLLGQLFLAAPSRPFWPPSSRPLASFFLASFFLAAFFTTFLASFFWLPSSRPSLAVTTFLAAFLTTFLAAFTTFWPPSSRPSWPPSSRPSPLLLAASSWPPSSAAFFTTFLAASSRPSWPPSWLRSYVTGSAAASAFRGSLRGAFFAEPFGVSSDHRRPWPQAERPQEPGFGASCWAGWGWPVACWLADAGERCVRTVVGVANCSLLGLALREGLSCAAVLSSEARPRSPIRAGDHRVEWLVDSVVGGEEREVISLRCSPMPVHGTLGASPRGSCEP